MSLHNRSLLLMAMAALNLGAGPERPSIEDERTFTLPTEDIQRCSREALLTALEFFETAEYVKQQPKGECAADEQQVVTLRFEQACHDRRTGVISTLRSFETDLFKASEGGDFLPRLRLDDCEPIVQTVIFFTKQQIEAELKRRMNAQGPVSCSAKGRELRYGSSIKMQCKKKPPIAPPKPDDRPPGVRKGKLT